MNWEAVGAAGEIIGALAVFITLVYLAIQIRQNTKAVQAAAIDSANTHVSNIRMHIFSDPDVTSLYRRGNEDPEGLSEEEAIRYRLLIHNILLALSNIITQANVTGLSESTSKTQLPVLVRVVSTPGGRWFWKGYREEFEESFRRTIDNMLSEQSSKHVS